MKKLIVLVTSLLLLHVYSFAQNRPDIYHDLGDMNDKDLINDMDYKPNAGMIELIPYNRQKHSVAEHAQFISGSYALLLRLSRKQSRQLYEEVLAAYQTPNALLAWTRSDKERQLIEATRIHNMLANKLKSILNVNQYLSYQKWSNYPENIFAKGW